MITKKDVTFYQRQKESTPEEIDLIADVHWDFHQLIPMYYGDQEQAIEAAKKSALNHLRHKLYGDVMEEVRKLQGLVHMLAATTTIPCSFEIYDKIKDSLSKLMNTGKEITED